MKNDHFVLIDVLRGFAAITVLVYHAIAHFNWESFPTSYGMIWFRAGWLGVDIFFVISGFVITLSALKLADNETYLSFQHKFLSRRARRILPLHYLTLALFIFLTPEVIHPEFFKDLLSHLFFYHNTIKDFHGSINGPNWSVGTEVQFYLLISLGIYFLKVKNLLLISLTFLLVCYLWRIIWFLCIPESASSWPYPLFIKVTQLPGMLDLFLTGILLAFFIRSDFAQRVIRGKLAQFFILLLASALTYATFAIYMKNGVYWDNIWMVTFFRTPIAMATGMIILLLCSIRVSAAVQNIIAPFIYLGTISYGIYLFHLPIMLQIKKFNLSPIWSLAITLAITLAVASMSWELYERKFIAKK